MSELKIFQCNYAPGRPPEVFLGVAVTAGLSQMHHVTTGQPTWRIDGRPFHLGPEKGSLAILAASQYTGVAGISGTVAGALPVAVQASLVSSQTPLPAGLARISGTVTLTMNAIPRGDAGTSIIAAFQDSGGWEFSEAEEVVDSSMRTIVACLQAEFPENGGWRMLQGAWQHAHAFDAPSGIPPSPPGSIVAEQPDAFPDDIYSNPRTGRNFTATIPAVDAGVLVHTIGDVLADTWAIEYATENFNGEVAQTFEGRNQAWSASQLSLNVMALQLPRAAFLTISFGDLGGWASPEANEALTYCLDVTKKMLQSKFAGATLVAAGS